MQKIMSEIYNPNAKEQGEFWKTDVPGKKLAGTFIALRDGTDMQGNPQPLYVIKEESGKVWVVSGKPAIAKQMEDVQLGQVLVFEYVGEFPSTKPGWRPSKRVIVHKKNKAGEAMFDPNWNAEEAVQEAEKVFGGEVMPDFGKNDVPFESKAPVNPLLNVINEFAKAKFGATTPELVATKVVGMTGLTMVEANYPAIIAALTKL